MAELVKMVTPKGNSALVAEEDVEKFKKEKGWSVESEDAEPRDEASEGGDEPCGTANVSADVKAKEAIAVILTLGSVEAVEAYTEGEDRKSVLEAADERVEELSAPENEE
jgi:hypothetical protein